MLNKMRFLFAGALVCLLGAPLASADSTPFIEDSFEQGERSNTWGSLVNAKVASLPTATGRSGNAMQFLFKGVAGDQDSWAEARFDLGAWYSVVSIEFDLFIPQNYEHRAPTKGTNNNKFFRMWGNTYDDVEKIGASMVRGNNDTSTLGSDYRVQATWGMSTAVKSAGNFIADADKGKWMTIKIAVRAPTDSMPGLIQIYKNGKVFLEDAAVPNHVAGTQGYRYGYLLGWANSGFSQDTYLYIDNLKIYKSLPVRPLPPGQR